MPLLYSSLSLRVLAPWTMLTTWGTPPVAPPTLTVAPCCVVAFSLRPADCEPEPAVIVVGPELRPGTLSVLPLP